MSFDKFNKRDVKVVSGLFLDFKKTFNTIHYGLMFSKLYDSRVRGTNHVLIKSYFSNRH